MGNKLITLYLCKMFFYQILNAAISKKTDRPLMQKEVYAVSSLLQQYLVAIGRDIVLPVKYSDLFHYRYTDAIKDENGKHTHWENVVYDKAIKNRLCHQLLATYYLLKNIIKETHVIDAIHFCEFANSMPFRITVSNTLNGAIDFFYVKAADASRIYGLELEHLLSPNRVVFFYHDNTLVEEHIEGIPGDVALQISKDFNNEENKQLAEAFIRFNERCFARLLGDMRSYNFVLINSECEGYRFRAIDFDQQSYEGKLHLYLPQFYKENYQYFTLCEGTFENTAIEKIREAERIFLKGLVKNCKQRLVALISLMQQDEISDNYKVISLRNELNSYFKTNNFSHCISMGDLVKQQLKQLLAIEL